MEIEPKTKEEIESMCFSCGDPIAKIRGMNYCGNCYKRLTKEGFELW